MSFNFRQKIRSIDQKLRVVDTKQINKEYTRKTEKSLKIALFWTK